MMKKTNIFLCLFIMLGVSVQAEITLDIDGAVARAIENNLSLSRTQTVTAAAKRKYDHSWNGLIPSVTAGALAAHATSITGPIAPASDVWTPGFTLSASWSIAPATFANIAQTREEYEAEKINYIAARQEIEFQVRRLYYQILLLKANMELAELNMTSAQVRYQQTLALQRAGRASNLEELSARLDVQTQQSNVHDARAVYENSLDSLKYILMIPVEDTVILMGDLVKIDLEESYAENAMNGGGMHMDSMQMAVLRQSISVIEAQKKTAQLRSYSPSLTLSWNTTPLYMEQLGGTWKDSSGQFSIALSFKLDNYLPWSSAKEQINTLDDAVAKQQSLLTETAINHQNTIQKLLRDIARSEETMETLLLNVTLAEETLKMYEEAYRSGAADLQTLNSTRDNLRTAQNRLLSEQFNLISAVLELEKELNLPFGSIANNM